MTNHFLLYFFDNRSDEFQTRREAALQEILDESDHWRVVDSGLSNLKPNFNLSVELVKPFAVKPAPTPAISYIMEKMADSGVASDICGAAQALICDIRAFQEKGAILGLDMTLPDGRVISSGAGPDSTIEFDLRFVVKHDATREQIAILDKMQLLEWRADMRIKFAPLDETGRRVSDADEEYATFFDDAPDGWSSYSEALEILTRSEGRRDARMLAGEGIEIATVTHETGVEFLLGIATGIAASALYDVIKWSLKKWIRPRRSIAEAGRSRAPTFVEMERTKRSPDGAAISSERIRLRAPVTDQALKSIISQLAKP